MKLASVCLVALVQADQKEDDVWYGPKGFAPRSALAQSGEADRRYNDLEDMATKYFKKNGSEKFDERKYLAYGCHCFILGDRAMSEMGQGTPKDALDVKCKAYKDCQNVSETSMVMHVLVNLSDTLGNGHQSENDSNQRMKSALANVNFSTAIYSLSRTLSTTKELGTRTTTVSGANFPVDSTTRIQKIVHPMLMAMVVVMVHQLVKAIHPIHPVVAALSQTSHFNTLAAVVARPISSGFQLERDTSNAVMINQSPIMDNAEFIFRLHLNL